MASIKETTIDKIAQDILGEDHINTEGYDFFEIGQETLIDLLVSAYRQGLEDANKKNITEVKATWQLRQYTARGFVNIGKPVASKRQALKEQAKWLRAHGLDSEDTLGAPHPYRING